MSDKNFKTIRKQLRNVVQELLPKLITEEVKHEMHKQFATEASAKLEKIQTAVAEALKTMDDRTKESQNLIVRALAGGLQPPEQGAPQPTTNTEETTTQTAPTS